MNRVLLFLLNFVYYPLDWLYRFTFYGIAWRYKLLEMLDEERTKMITRKFLEMIQAQEEK